MTSPRTPYGWTDSRPIQIHPSKGGKSRIVPLREHLADDLRRWVRLRQVLHGRDLGDVIASVWLPCLRVDRGELCGFGVFVRGFAFGKGGRLLMGLGSLEKAFGSGKR